MNTSKRKCLTRRIARKGERGFTLMEILVALAIVGIIVAVTAAALGGRATTARLEAVATQVASVIQARQNLFINDLRSNDITMAELASEMGTVFANSTIIDGANITGYDTTTTMDACAVAGAGIKLELEMNALSAAEAETLQQQIKSAVDNLFSSPAAGGELSTVFTTSATRTATLAGAAAAGGAAGVVHLCIGP